jgi:hypothetical protein
MRCPGTATFRGGLGRALGSMKAIIGLIAGLMLADPCLGQEWLDHLDDKLSLRSPNGTFRTDVTGLLDLEGYYVDQQPPGLLFGQESFFNPRATFFVDSQFGPHIYGFLQARLDRGFDPGVRDFDARLDEYLLRWKPWNDGRLNLQVGKFASVVGSWVQRHDSWQNPLITAPLPYENMTAISDWEPARSPAAFLARRGIPDQKADWVPVLWGPVYATGGAVLGTVGKFDYAFDFKNAALSSRPEEWEVNHLLWRYPTVSGRLGIRPNAAWNHGVSFSVGPYLNSEAEEYLAPGRSIGDYQQMTLGYDASYAWRRWQLWSELFLTRFEVPGLGNADSLAYYLEAKYKLTTGLFAAARWNQQLFATVADGIGGQQAWDNNMVRIDLALGYRFTRHLQSKIQYSFGHRDGSRQQGEQLVAAQLTVKF